MRVNINNKPKNLRSRSTDVERKLWRLLKNRQLVGLKFRRQYPVGPYIVDFICLEKGLIIELDGSQHMEHKTYDSERDAWLKTQGFRILRFWNNMGLQEPQPVLETILKACDTLDHYPHLSPLPRIGRGDKKPNI